MLDGQTPYIKVVTDRGDNVMLYYISKLEENPHRSTYNEAAIDANTQTQQHEDKCYLIRSEAQCAWPESQSRSQ